MHTGEEGCSGRVVGFGPTAAVMTDERHGAAHSAYGLRLQRHSAGFETLQGVRARVAHVERAVRYTSGPFTVCIACALYCFRVECLLHAGQFWLCVCMLARSLRRGRVCEQLGRVGACRAR